MQALDVVAKPKYQIPTLELQLESNWLIPFVVGALHLLALSLLTITSLKQEPKKVPKKLIVHTVSLTAPKPIDRVKAPPKAAPKPTPLPVAEEPKMEEAHVESPKPVEIPAEVKTPAKSEPAPAPVATPQETPKPAPKPAPKPTPKPAPKPKAKAPPKPTPKPTPKPAAKAPPKPKPAPKAEVKKKQDDKAQKQKQEADRRQKEKEAAAKREKEQREQEAKERAKEQARQQAILDKAFSSLDSAGSIEGKKSAIAKSASKSSSSAPSAISTLAAESLVAIEAEGTIDFTPAERTYYDELARRLKLALKLPEYGEVKLQLTIARSGKVVTVKNIKSKSKKNSDYIQKAVPKLHLPPFGQNFSGEKEHTFRLTLSSELSY